MRSVALLLASMPALLSAQIMLDQRFEDWEEVGLAGENMGNVHLQRTQATSNDAWMYWRVSLGEELALDETIINHGIELWVDADANATTGFSAEGMGVELVFDFHEAELRRYNANGTVSILTFNDVGLHQAPTYSGEEVELALDRGLAGLDNSLFVRWQWFDTVHEETLPAQPVTTVLSATEASYEAIDLSRGTGAQLRSMWWNVNGRMNNSSATAAMGRIVEAVVPDVIGFNEVANVSAGHVQGLLESWLPGTTWYVVKDDYDLMVASIYPLGDSFSGVFRSFPVVVETETLWGLPMLFTSSHLKCCGGASNEAQRQSEADEYMEFQRDAMTEGGLLDLPYGSPIVFGGDLNMVGLSGPIKTIETGDIADNGSYGPDFSPDWDGTSMLELPILQADRPMDYTWRNDNSQYMPGKLDYAIVSDAVVEAVRMFGLQTNDMSNDRLNQYGLLSGDTWASSDHLPIVVDLMMVGAQAVDTDEDGVLDALDNCAEVPNPDQGDFNGNGTGDMCEDSDADGLMDFMEINWGTDPSVQDTDGDGLTDGVEIDLFGTDPLSADSDGDGISDSLELLFPPSTTCPGDLNGDNAVTASDLLLLLASFGEVC